MSDRLDKASLRAKNMTVEEGEALYDQLFLADGKKHSQASPKDKRIEQLEEEIANLKDVIAKVIDIASKSPHNLAKAIEDILKEKKDE